MFEAYSLHRTVHNSPLLSCRASCPQKLKARWKQRQDGGFANGETESL